MSVLSLEQLAAALQGQPVETYAVQIYRAFDELPQPNIKEAVIPEHVVDACCDRARGRIANLLARHRLTGTITVTHQTATICRQPTRDEAAQGKVKYHAPVLYIFVDIKRVRRLWWWQRPRRRAKPVA